MNAGVYFDGDRALPVPVTLELSEDRQVLMIRGQDVAPVDWPVADIRRVADQASHDETVLRLRHDPVARVVMEGRASGAVFPALDRRAPPKGRGRLAAWAVAAIAAVALQVFVLVPLIADQLAVFIPAKGERALGEATLGQIQRALDESGLGAVAICENPNGTAALRKMEARLTQAAGLDRALSVHVLDHKMVNAFALPGGYVTLFDGLITAAETPEEVAAVFAHEMGHVVSRDPTRHALRSAGSIGILGLLFGDFAGGAVVLFLAERLIDAQYAQDAEAGADQFATQVLLKAGVSPAALGDFFDRLRAKQGDSSGLVAHFLSHPALGDRIAAARAAVPEGGEFTPILSAEEWQALRGICD